MIIIWRFYSSVRKRNVLVKWHELYQDLLFLWISVVWEPTQQNPNWTWPALQALCNEHTNTQSQCNEHTKIYKCKTDCSKAVLMCTRRERGLALAQTAVKAGLCDLLHLLLRADALTRGMHPPADTGTARLCYGYQWCLKLCMYWGEPCCYVSTFHYLLLSGLTIVVCNKRAKIPLIYVEGGIRVQKIIGPLFTWASKQPPRTSE